MGKDWIWVGVYVTDPAVATFLGPELTDRAQECAIVAKPFEKVQSHKRQMQIGS